MYCKKCGTDNPDGAVYCRNCGFELSAARRNNASSAPAPHRAAGPDRLDRGAAPAPSYGRDMRASAPRYGAKDAAPAGSEEAEAAAQEDGQNPVMNFIGVYGHDRASIMVEADGMDGAKITVTWGASAAENAEWVMSGKFDPETLTVAYTDCVKTVYVWNEQGEIDSETVEYENGEGTITFTDGEALSLTWDDAQEHIADGTVFEYASLAG